jgi:Mg-chelatase subunit ChlD
MFVSGFPVSQTPVDLVFAIDSSGSVGKANYQMQKKFLKLFLRDQYIGQYQTRLGVIVYSYTATVAIKLSAYYKIDDLSVAIDRLAFYGKTTRISEALTLTERQMLTEAEGRRQEIPAVVVLITDGLLLSASGISLLKVLNSIGDMLLLLLIGFC